MSELAGPWLNLPMLVAGTSDLVKSNQNDPKYEHNFHRNKINANIHFIGILLHHPKVDNVEKVFIISSLVDKMPLTII